MKIADYLLLLDSSHARDIILDLDRKDADFLYNLKTIVQYSHKLSARHIKDPS